jgi:DNA repair protein RecO (recombination protein O)
MDVGDPVDPRYHYVVEPGRGTRLADADDLGEPIAGATLLALARGDSLGADQVRQARTLLRRLLEPHLGPKPLKSRELFRRAGGGTGHRDTTPATDIAVGPDSRTYGRVLNPPLREYLSGYQVRRL